MGGSVSLEEMLTALITSDNRSEGNSHEHSCALHLGAAHVQDLQRLLLYLPQARSTNSINLHP